MQQSLRFAISIHPEQGALLRVMSLLERRRYVVRDASFAAGRGESLSSLQVTVDRLGGPTPGVLLRMLEKLEDVRGVELDTAHTIGVVRA